MRPSEITALTGHDPTHIAKRRREHINILAEVGSLSYISPRLHPQLYLRSAPVVFVAVFDPVDEYLTLILTVEK